MNEGHTDIDTSTFFIAGHYFRSRDWHFHNDHNATREEVDAEASLIIDPRISGAAIVTKDTISCSTGC